MRRNIPLEVKLHFDEMRKLGMSVPKGVNKFIKSRSAEITDCHNGGLTISQIADLVCSLVQL